MEFKLFTDLIDAPGKVAGGLKAIVKLPITVGESMGQTLDENYCLTDTKPAGQGVSRATPHIHCSLTERVEVNKATKPTHKL